MEARLSAARPSRPQPYSDRARLLLAGPLTTRAPATLLAAGNWRRSAICTIGPKLPAARSRAWK